MLLDEGSPGEKARCTEWGTYLPGLLWRSALCRLGCIADDEPKPAVVFDPFELCTRESSPLLLAPVTQKEWAIFDCRCKCLRAARDICLRQ